VGAYSAPQTPYLNLRGLLLRKERGRDESGKGGRKREERGDPLVLAYTP